MSLTEKILLKNNFFWKAWFNIRLTLIAITFNKKSCRLLSVSVGMYAQHTTFAWHAQYNCNKYASNMQSGKMLHAQRLDVAQQKCSDCATGTILFFKIKTFAYAYIRQCLNKLQKEYCVKTKIIALDWSWCQMNRNGHSSPVKH